MNAPKEGFQAQLFKTCVLTQPDFENQIKIHFKPGVWRQISGDECLNIQMGLKCLNIHIGVKCHLMSNVTCLIVVKCLWRQSSQPLTNLRGPA